MKTDRAASGQRKGDERRDERGVVAVGRPKQPHPTPTSSRAVPATTGGAARPKSVAPDARKPPAPSLPGSALRVPRSASRTSGARKPPPTTKVARRRGRWYALWASGQALALLGALVCGGLLAYFLTTSDVNVQSVVVGGAGLSTPEDLAAAGGVTGHNIFTVDPQVVADRLIALPTVRDAQVWSELPDRLIIQVSERQPALLWQVNADRYLLDETGHIIALNPPAARQQQLARVVSHDTAALQVGGQVAAAPVQTALAIARRAADVGLPLAGIEYAANSGIVIIVNDNQGVGRQIIVGNDTRLADKVAVAAEIYRTAPTWAVLNVTDPDRPFFPAR